MAPRPWCRWRSAEAFARTALAIYESARSGRVVTLQVLE